MLEIILALIGGGLFGFLGAILALFANRGKNKVEINKILEETELIRVNAQKEVQVVIQALQTQVDSLYKDLQDERAAKRKEIDRMHQNIEQLQQALSIESGRNFRLTSEIDAIRKASFENQLAAEKEIQTLKKALTGQSLAIGEIKKQTGNLENKFVRTATDDLPTVQKE
jgi:hypothetical protein